MSLRGFMSLQRGERRASIKAILLLPFIEMSLRFGGLPKTARRFGVSLEKGDAAISLAPPSDEQMMAMRASARATLRWVAPDTCLRRALLTAALLRHESPTIRIGVRSGEGGLQAHAWVEVAGASLDQGSQNYTPLIAAWTEAKP